MWEKALRLSFSKIRGGRIDMHMVRDTWNNEARDPIAWWFSPTEDRIYVKSGNEWIIWSIALNAKRRTTKNGQLYQKASSKQLKPDDCIPPNITKVEKSLREKLKTDNRTMTGHNQKEKSTLRNGNNADGQSVLMILKKMEGQSLHTQYRPTTEKLYAMDHLKKENPAQPFYP